jgi:hypothetical protein
MVKSIAGEQSERMRPNSRLQPQSLLESTPVLFRLPTIQTNIASSNAGQSAFTPVEQPMGRPVTGKAYSPDGQQPEVAEQPGVAQPEMATQQYTHPPQKTGSESQGSWWEHWSSGVVLVSVALTTLLIIFFLMRVTAGTSQSSVGVRSIEDEFGDLDLISVPTLESVTVQPSLMTVNAPSSAEPSSPNPLTREQTANLDSGRPVEESAPELVEKPNEQFSEMAAQLAGVDIPESNGSNQPAVEQPITGSAANEAVASSTEMVARPEADHSEPVATAQLDRDQLVRQIESTNLTRSNLAATTAPDIGTHSEDRFSGLPELPIWEDNTSGRGTLPQLAESASASRPVSTSDGSAVGITQPGQLLSSQTSGNGGELNWTGAGSLPSQVVSPSESSQLASSMPNLNGQRASVPKGASTASAQLKTGGNVTSAAPKIRTTATPESNEEEIIRAYLELMGAGRASNNGSGQEVNRYQGGR